MNDAGRHGRLQDGRSASELETLLRERFDARLDPLALGDQPALVIDRKRICDCLRFLRDEPELCCDCLLDITVVDYLSYPGWRGERFAVVYLLKSTRFRHRLRLKCLLEEDDAEIDSVHELYRIADWLERECFDQYGVRFAGHPNLRRLLNHHEFVGHPLRKDYPVQKRQHLSVNDPMLEELVQRLGQRGYEVLEDEPVRAPEHAHPIGSTGFPKDAR